MLFLFVYLILILGGGALITYGIVHNEFSRNEATVVEPTVAPEAVVATPEPTTSVTPTVTPIRNTTTVPSATNSAR